MNEEHDKNCKEAIEAMRKCTNKMSLDNCSSDAEKEFLKFCEEIGCLFKWKNLK